jgi:protein transport protein SEC24
MAFILIKVLPVWELKDAIYPRFYSLHDLPDAVGLRDENNRLPMPILRQLTAENIDRAGIYLVKTGLDM